MKVELGYYLENNDNPYKRTRVKVIEVKEEYVRYVLAESWFAGITSEWMELYLSNYSNDFLSDYTKEED